MPSVLPVNSYLPTLPSIPEATSSVPGGAAVSLPHIFHEVLPFPPRFSCILALLSQYALLHSHSAAGSKTVRPVPIFYSAYLFPPSNLIIIINISADITPPKNPACYRKGNGQCSQYTRTRLIPFSNYLFYSQPLTLSEYILVGLDHSLFSCEADGHGK